MQEGEVFRLRRDDPHRVNDIHLGVSQDDLLPEAPQPRIVEAARTDMDARRCEITMGPGLKIPAAA